MGTWVYCDWCNPDINREATHYCVEFTEFGSTKSEEIDLCDECFDDLRKDRREHSMVRSEE